MSLDYDFSAIENYREKCWTKPDEHGDSQLTALGHLMPFACLFLHLNGVTEKNIEEWMYRLGVFKKIGNSIGTVGMDEWWPTREEVESMIGLRTNVSNKTHAQFNKMMIDEIDRTALRDYETFLYNREYNNDAG